MSVGARFLDLYKRMAATGWGHLSVGRRPARPGGRVGIAQIVLPRI